MNTKDSLQEESSISPVDLQVPTMVNSINSSSESDGKQYISVISYMETSSNIVWRQQSTHKKPTFPLRYYIALIGCLSSAVMYAARANLSVAMLTMLSEKHFTLTNGTNEDVHITPTSDRITFDWCQRTQGIILGSYYYGFAGFQVLTGFLADRYNPVYLNVITHIMATLMTLLTPFAAQLGEGYISTVRIILGIVHAPMLSSLYSLYAKWFPPHEISIPICLMIVGSNLGTAAIMPITAWLCKQTYLGGWPLAFYFTGAVNILIPILWYFFVTPCPSEHRCITEHEKLSIMAANVNTGKIKVKINWKALLTSPILWSITLAKAGTGFGYMIVNTKIPAYLESQLGMDLKSNGNLNGILYIALCTSQLLSGPVTKFLFRKNILSTTAIRKLFESLALLVPAIALVIIANIPTDPQVITLLLIISMFAFGGNAAGDMPIVSEIAPELSGTIFGITNTIGAATGFIAPLIAGMVLYSGDTRENWGRIFYLTAGFMAATALVFDLFAKSDPQPWGLSSGSSDEQLHRSKSSIESGKSQTKKRRVSHPIFSAQLSNV